MKAYARLVNGVVAELLPETVQTERGAISLAERFHPDFVASLVEAPTDAQVGWIMEGDDIVPPPAPFVPTHADLVAEAITLIRAERQPIIGVLDGLQSSALAMGDVPAAQAIEAAKQALRNLTSIDLSSCATLEDMRHAVKAVYAQIVSSASPSVRLAFKEAMQ